MNLIRNILAVGLLIGLAVGLYFGVIFLTGLFSAFEVELQSSIYIFVAAAVFIAILSGITGRWILDRKMLARMRLRKVNVYQHFLAAWAMAMKEPTASARARLKEAEQQLLLLASHRTLKLYDEVSTFVENESESSELSQSIEKLLCEMRTDIGQRTLNIREGMLLELLLGRGVMKARDNNGLAGADHEDMRASV